MFKRHARDDGDLRIHDARRVPASTQTALENGPIDIFPCKQPQRRRREQLELRCLYARTRSRIKGHLDAPREILVAHDAPVDLDALGILDQVRRYV